MFNTDFLKNKHKNKKSIGLNVLTAFRFEQSLKQFKLFQVNLSLNLLNIYILSSFKSCLGFWD